MTDFNRTYNRIATVDKLAGTFNKLDAGNKAVRVTNPHRDRREIADQLIHVELFSDYRNLRGYQ
jgi:hypothetical protein